ncbi:hypothetical protein AGR4B_pAt10014 [Agrobacterium tumefaciens str. CFBP 5621]|nr:hypothetical protein AGR4B_pAt10014 [Agrobacterium tumefaciens str. CFBP 5621]
MHPADAVTLKNPRRLVEYHFISLSYIFTTGHPTISPLKTEISGPQPKNTSQDCDLPFRKTRFDALFSSFVTVDLANAK